MSNHQAVNKQKYNWRLENVAKCLCEFDKILKSFFSKVVVADAVIPTAIKSFQEYMSGPVTEVSTLITIENSRSVGLGNIHKKW